ncbi:hypothetical protein [Streptomyces sp. NPDC058861]|uniref:hypothetical protein n=1 Tax=Streptomyces sp. NPDC058861 TaxID=3346653 RepID=UPI0036C9F3D4
MNSASELLQNGHDRVTAWSTEAERDRRSDPGQLDRDVYPLGWPLKRLIERRLELSLSVFVTIYQVSRVVVGAGHVQLGEWTYSTNRFLLTDRDVAAYLYQELIHERLHFMKLVKNPVPAVPAVS